MPECCSFKLWEKLIPQAEITINLLQGSRINPKLSAYAQANGKFDYNRTPIAPPGTRVIIHKKTDQRASWVPHGVNGWYLGPAMESYRCYKVWVRKTNAERITDTLAWIPHNNFRMPTRNNTETIIAAAQELTNAFKIQHLDHHSHHCMTQNWKQSEKSATSSKQPPTISTSEKRQQKNRQQPNRQQHL